jgi:hypothetical protein
MSARYPIAVNCARQMTWRAMVSLCVAIAVLLGSLQHLSCLTEDDSQPAGTASLAATFENGGAPVGEPAVLAHCHCVCHVSAQAFAEPVSSPVEFGGAAYVLAEDHLPREPAALPPFEPPRA